MYYQICLSALDIILIDIDNLRRGFEIFVGLILFTFFLNHCWNIVKFSIKCCLIKHDIGFGGGANNSNSDNGWGNSCTSKCSMSWIVLRSRWQRSGQKWKSISAKVWRKISKNSKKKIFVKNGHQLPQITNPHQDPWGLKNLVWLILLDQKK